MVALPDHTVVFAVGVPGLGAVPLAALTAAYLAGEKVYTAVPPSALFPALKFLLYQFKHLRADDGFVVAFDVVLRNLALVDLCLLGQEVDRVGFLQQGVTLVLLV